MQNTIFNSAEPDFIKVTDMNELKVLVRDLPDGVILSISVEEDGSQS